MSEPDYARRRAGVALVVRPADGPLGMTVAHVGRGAGRLVTSLIEAACGLAPGDRADCINEG
jgi:hypothetical protein